MISPVTIGIFDSGIGGLSVWRALRQQLPHARLLYVADSAHAPYGIKTPTEVLTRSRHIARFLIEEQRVDALVIACNTATAAAASELRAEFPLPVVAMEPGLKPALAASQNGIIAVLATQGTLASQQFANLRERYATGVDVIDLACRGWVKLVEKGEHESQAAYRLVAETLKPVLEKGADTLVLGCTHFPFLHNAIRAACGDQVSLIETAEAVAKQTARRLGELPSIQEDVTTGDSSSRFWSSGDCRQAEEIIGQLTKQAVTVEQLPN